METARMGLSHEPEILESKMLIRWKFQELQTFAQRMHAYQNQMKGIHS